MAKKKKVTPANTGLSIARNINVTVNGADNPEDWARRLTRQMQLEMRTI